MLAAAGAGSKLLLLEQLLQLRLVLVQPRRQLVLLRLDARELALDLVAGLFGLIRARVQLLDLLAVLDQETVPFGDLGGLRLEFLLVLGEVGGPAGDDLVHRLVLQPWESRGGTGGRGGEVAGGAGGTRGGSGVVGGCRSGSGVRRLGSEKTSGSSSGGSASTRSGSSRCGGSRLGGGRTEEATSSSRRRSSRCRGCGRRRCSRAE